MNINTAEYWNRAWGIEGTKTWRIYPGCFEKVVKLIGTGKRVLDVGGGVGILAARLKENGNFAFIVDVSDVAVSIAYAVFKINGVAAKVPPLPELQQPFDYVVATEFLEHLSIDEIVHFLAKAAVKIPRAIYAVPNNILGPEDEKEHQVKFTDIMFYEMLTRFYSSVKIESFTDEFFGGKGTVQDGKVVPVITRIPTLLAYCEV